MKRVIAPIVLFLIAAMLFGLSGCRNTLCPVGVNPCVSIHSPAYRPGLQTYPPNISIEWHCCPNCPCRFIRYLITEVIDTNGVYDPDFPILPDLNENPRRYENMWSRWKPYNGPDGDGRKVFLCCGTLKIGRTYFFAVQARDLCGRVTTHFGNGSNAYKFLVWEPF